MITLDKQHYKVLAYIYRHQYIHIDELRKKFENIDVIGKNLLNWGLVHYTVAENFLAESQQPKTLHPGDKPNAFAVTDFDGNLIVEQKLTTTFSIVVPIAISVLSLIVSVIGIFV